MNGPRTILDCSMRKLPSSRKMYQVRLIVPDNGIPIIEYHQLGSFVSSKKPTKSLQFADLLFADKKHDTSEKWAFSIYSTNKTITFLPQDETIMNEWLTKVRELHSNLYPEFKRYDAIFEANLLEKGLARTMHIQGSYRLALCKDSLDLIPLLSEQDQLQHQQTFKTPTTATTNNHHSHNNNQHHHHPFETHLPKSNFNHSSTPTTLNSPSALTKSHHQHLPQHLPSHQRFCKRHPLLASRTIELVLRSIRRCGHTDSNFYIESGRHSQIGEGDLWMALNKKSTARYLHELLLATMKLASNDDQFIYKPRSRSGSSSDNAHRPSQSRSSSLVCLAAEISPMFLNHDKMNKKIEEDSGYLPMA